MPIAIRNTTDADFKKKTRPPLKILSLRETEELIYPAYFPEPFSLSTESLGMLLAMLRSLFGAKEEPEFSVLKEFVFESLPDEAKLNVS